VGKWKLKLNLRGQRSTNVIAAWGGGFYSNSKEIDYTFGTTGVRVYFNSRDRVNKITTTTLYQTKSQLNSARSSTIRKLENDGFSSSGESTMSDGSRIVTISTDQMQGVYRLLLTFK